MTAQVGRIEFWCQNLEKSKIDHFTPQKPLILGHFYLQNSVNANKYTQNSVVRALKFPNFATSVHQYIFVVILILVGFIESILAGFYGQFGVGGGQIGQI